MGDAPLVGAGSELELTIDGHVVAPADGLFVGRNAEGVSRAPARNPAAGVGEGLEQRNLFAVAEQLAARAATPSTRRQYAAIYRSFGDWLRRELGRPPVVGDLESDVIGAYARYLETAGGRGGRPAAPATRRIYLSMIRALTRELGRAELAAGVKVPRHKPGPPETITERDYQNLLRVPDRRSQIGKRDHALLRVLGDCGLRSAELRGLIARDLRRPRANARHVRRDVARAPEAVPRCQVGSRALLSAEGGLGAERVVTGGAGRVVDPVGR